MDVGIGILMGSVGNDFRERHLASREATVICQHPFCIFFIFWNNPMTPVVEVVLQSLHHISDATAGMHWHRVEATIAHYLTTFFAVMTTSVAIDFVVAGHASSQGSVPFRFPAIADDEDAFSAFPVSVATAKNQVVPLVRLTPVHDDAGIVSFQLATPEPRMVKVIPRPNSVTIVIEYQVCFLTLNAVALGP